MKKLLSICAVILFCGFTVNTLAANEHQARRDKVLADKTIAEPVRKELKEYFEKSNAVYTDCKQKRKEVRDSLSPEAKKALTKHKTKKAAKKS